LKHKPKTGKGKKMEDTLETVFTFIFASIFVLAKLAGLALVITYFFANV